jgi:preprotein translocase subunit SecF
VTAALAESYGISADEVTYSFIGPAWGQDITKQAVIALIVFILFAALVMAIYFRTWKMSLAAIIALFHDLIITAGIYGISGFEITPAAMIGFLTILGYSLYDTVVVFDKIRENTAPGELNDRRTFAESVNLGVNQTLVRSINTSVVALLPVGSILFIGAFVLGAGTLRDISLALFIGILVGAYSTIFIAAPAYAHLREGEEAVKRHDEKVLRIRAKKEPAEDESVAAEA